MIKNKGFVGTGEGDNLNSVLDKLTSLKRFWSWADKLKDQHHFYIMQEQKNPRLKSAKVLSKDSTMFLALYVAVIGQMLKSFADNPKVELPDDIRLVKDGLSFNLHKFGDAVCDPGKLILNEKFMMDASKPQNIALINGLHVNLGYYIDKKIQEMKNRDVFPFAMNK